VFKNIASLSLLLCLARPAAAQEFRATVFGVITDPSGAAIPAAKVSTQQQFGASGFSGTRPFDVNGSWNINGSRGNNEFLLDGAPNSVRGATTPRPTWTPAKSSR